MSRQSHSLTIISKISFSADARAAPTRAAAPVWERLNGDISVAASSQRWRIMRQHMLRRRVKPRWCVMKPNGQWSCANEAAPSTDRMWTDLANQWSPLRIHHVSLCIEAAPRPSPPASQQVSTTFWPPRRNFSNVSRQHVDLFYRPAPRLTARGCLIPVMLE